jgi:hypothetical protein
MTAAFKFKGWLLALALCLPATAWADTQNTPPNTHHVHKTAAKKQELPPPLPSGPQGPVPQVPLDAMPAVAPQVSYQDGLLTIVAPNSTLGEILRSVRKHTSAEIDVPSNANERVVTRLGPAPAREVMAELLNGSHFNYILLGSPENSNQLVRVVLVPKTGDTAKAQPAPGDNSTQAAQPAADASENTDAQDDSQSEDNPDQPTEAEQQAIAPDQPVKSPQQMLQEMQQRQMQMQQGQPGQPQFFPGRPGTPMPQQQQPQQQDQ